MSETLLNEAILAVRKSALLCRAVQAQISLSDATSKEDRSPVTVADYGSQALILHHLSSLDEIYPAVAEEGSRELKESASDSMRAEVYRQVQKIESSLSDTQILDAIDLGQDSGGAGRCFWTLDPIDGTKGFIRKDQYAIALALIEDSRVKLGVLGCPNLPFQGHGAGTLFFASEGQPARMAPLLEGDTSEIQTSEIREASQIRFCESFESGHSSHDAASQIAHLLQIRAASVRMDSQAKYGAVGRGDAEAYLRLPTRAGYEEKIWDHAAGSFIVERAGGRVTDIEGAPLDLSCGRTLKNNRGIVASNGLLHDQILDAIARIIPHS